MRVPSDAFDWWVMADPGNAGSPFAVLFAAHDKPKAKLYFVDELYETDGMSTTVGQVGPKIIQKCIEHHPFPNEWNGHYDTAALWFYNNFTQQFPDCGIIFNPVDKPRGEEKREDGIDTLNDMLLARDIIISTRCGNLIWEFDNYVRDKKGRLVSRHNNQIDNSRYLIKMAGIIAGKSVEKKESDERRRAKRRKRYVSYNQDQKEKQSGGLMGRILSYYGEHDD